jgi:hypothetical protein
MRYHEQMMLRRVPDPSQKATETRASVGRVSRKPQKIEPRCSIKISPQRPPEHGERERRRHWVDLAEVQGPELLRLHRERHRLPVLAPGRHRDEAPVGLKDDAEDAEPRRRGLDVLPPERLPRRYTGVAYAEPRRRRLDVLPFGSPGAAGMATSEGGRRSAPGARRRVPRRAPSSRPRRRRPTSRVRRP